MTEGLIDGLRKLTDKLKHPLENSTNTYSYPFPEGTKVEGVEVDIPSHEGPFRGAIDFLVPIDTPVLCARKGTVTAVLDIHEGYGPTEEFAGYYNYIQIQHDNGEITEYGHIGVDTAKVRVGQVVEEGQKLAITGKSGWMDKPHLHFLVYRLDPKEEKGFRGLIPRFNNEQDFKKLA